MRIVHYKARRIPGRLMLLVLITIFACGCGPSNSVVGKWKTEVTYSSGVVTEVFDFGSDGTMTERVTGSSLLTSCKYTVRGNTLTIIPVKTTSFGKSVDLPEKNMAPQVYSFKIYGESLTLTGGQTDFIFTRSRV